MVLRTAACMMARAKGGQGVLLDARRAKPRDVCPADKLQVQFAALFRNNTLGLSRLAAMPCSKLMRCNKHHSKSE